MAQRDKYFWVKVLIGTAFGLLIVDVLALTVLDIPLLKWQRVRSSTSDPSARLTQTAMDEALILPTYDPSKPRPSRTPRPTSTPWLIARVTPTPAPSVTPEPPALLTQAPADTAESGMTPQASSTAAPAMPAAPSAAVDPARPTGAPGPKARPPGAVARIVVPTPTLMSPVGVDLASTPTPSEMPPEETPVAADDTPEPTPLPDTPEPSPTMAPGDFLQFTAYVEEHYNSIAGQPLEVGDVSIFTAGTGIPEVTVEVIGDSTNSVFAQTPAALDYGRRLLNDTKLYFDGQPFSISVVGKYDASDPGPCNDNPSWCTVGQRNQSDNSWSIAWTYIRGTSNEGSDSVEAWNAGQ